MRHPAYPPERVARCMAPVACHGVIGAIPACLDLGYPETRIRTYENAYLLGTRMNKVRATSSGSPRRNSSGAKSYQPSPPAARGRTLRLALMSGRLPRSVLIMAIATSAAESSAAPVVRSEASYWLTTTPISAHKTAAA
jgi:hypothetical protein